MNDNMVKSYDIIDLFFQKNDKLEIDYSQSKKYKVPLYQRAYRWKNELCQILYNDITKTKSYSLQYNFGFITLAKIPKEVNSFDIIDGQQRTISIYLLILALYNTAKRLSDKIIDYHLLYEFTKCNIPFSTNHSTINSLSKVLNNALNDSEIIIDKNDNKEIYNNYDVFNKMINDDIIGLHQNSQKIKKINELYKTLSTQRIYALEFEKRQNALESFISLNMKSEELDGFEILSALLLSKIEIPEKEIEYRDKLDQLYKLFMEINVFPTFDSYLFNLIWTQDGLYKKYCDDNEKLKNEVRITMPKHYIEEFIHVQSDAENFIDDALFVTERYIGIESKGEIKWLQEYLYEQHKESYRKAKHKLKLIEHILSIENIKKIVITQRYTLAMLYIIRAKIKPGVKSIDLNNFIIDMLNELTILLCEQHVLNITETIRISKEYQSIVKPNALRSVRKEWIIDKNFEKETIFKIKKIKRPACDYDFPIFDSKKTESLKLFYQVTSSHTLDVIKKGEDIILEADYEENLEHFFIDSSRSNKLPSKNAIGFNTFKIPRNLNDRFAELKLNSFMSKVDFILSKDIKEYQRYYWFYSLCRISKNAFNSIIETDLNMSSDRFIDIKRYYTENIKLLENDVDDFLRFHSVFLGKIKTGFITDFINRISKFNYEDNKILDTY